MPKSCDVIKLSVFTAVETYSCAPREGIDKNGLTVVRERW